MNMCRMHVRGTAGMANITVESRRRRDPRQWTCANETTIRDSLARGPGGYWLRRSSASPCARVPPCAQPCSDASMRMAPTPTPIGRARPPKTRTRGSPMRPPHPTRNRSRTAPKSRKRHGYWIFFASLRPSRRRVYCFQDPRAVCALLLIGQALVASTAAGRGPLLLAPCGGGPAKDQPVPTVVRCRERQQDVAPNL